MAAKLIYNPESLVKTQVEGIALLRLRGFHAGDWVYEGEDRVVRVGPSGRVVESWWDTTLEALLQWGGLAERERVALGHTLAEELKKPHGVLRPEVIQKTGQRFSLFRGREPRQPFDRRWAGYLAPEVVRGGVGTTASDSWSVAVIGHQCLTGRLPFPSQTPEGVVADVCQGQLAVDERLPSDLEALVKGALRRFPDNRPRLEDVLRLFRGNGHKGTEVLATWSSAPSSHVGLSFDGQAVAWLEGGRLALKFLGEAKRLSGSDYQWLALSGSSPLAALGKGGEVLLYDLESERVVRSWELEDHEYRGPDPLKQEVAPLGGPHRGAVFSPDGHLLAIADGWLIWVYTLNGRSLARLRTGGDVKSLDFSPDCRRIVSWGEDRVMRVWDVDSRCELHNYSWGGQDLQFTPSGTVLTGWAGRVQPFDPTVHPIIGPEGAEPALHCLAQKRQGLVWYDGLNQQLRIEQGDEVESLSTEVNSLACPSGESRLVTAGSDGVKVWALGQPEPEPARSAALREPATGMLVRGDLAGMEISRDLQTMARLGSDRIDLFDFKARPKGVLKGQFQKIRCGAGWLAGLTDEGQLRVWKVDGLKEISLPRAHGVFDFDLCGSRLAIAGQGVTVLELDQSRIELSLPQTSGLRIRLNAKGDRLALSDGRNIRVWDTQEGWFETDLVGVDMVWSGNFLATLAAGQAWVWPGGPVLEGQNFNRVYGDPDSPLFLFAERYQMSAWDPVAGQETWLGAALDLVDFTASGRLMVKLPEGLFLLEAPWRR